VTAEINNSVSPFLLSRVVLTENKGDIQYDDLQRLVLQPLPPLRPFADVDLFLLYFSPVLLLIVTPSPRHTVCPWFNCEFPIAS
jgi:hypothetical protein